MGENPRVPPFCRAQVKLFKIQAYAVLWVRVTLNFHELILYIKVERPLFFITE